MDMITRTVGPGRRLSGNKLSPVNSHNEWDPLEEVIVGRLEGATMPSDHPVVTCNIPTGLRPRAVARRRPPLSEDHDRAGAARARWLRCAAEVAGHRRPRPEPVEHKKRFSTPDWSSRGFCNSCPRDACWSSATRSSKRRWFGRAATSRRIPIVGSSRTTSGGERAGRPRPNRS